MTDRERELQAQLDALKAERRKEDVDRWKKLETSQQYLLKQTVNQNASLARIEEANKETNSRLKAGDTRFDAHDARLDKLEKDIKFYNRLWTYVTRIATTLGLGWLALKLGLKD